MTEWTDERIHRRYNERYDESRRNEPGYPVLNMRDVAREMRDDYAQRIEELERIIAYIDAHAPRADDSCNEPGITLSEAARRALNEKGEL